MGPRRIHDRCVGESNRSKRNRCRILGETKAFRVTWKLGKIHNAQCREERNRPTTEETHERRSHTVPPNRDAYAHGRPAARSVSGRKTTGVPNVEREFRVVTEHVPVKSDALLTAAGTSRARNSPGPTAVSGSGRVRGRRLRVRKSSRYPNRQRTGLFGPTNVQWAHFQKFEPETDNTSE